MKFYDKNDFEKRNLPCHCGSGKKFKHCCFNKGDTGSSVAVNKPLRPKPNAKAKEKPSK